MGDFGYDVYVKVNGSLRKIGFTTKTEYSFNIPTGTSEVIVKSAYSKFKSNSSTGTSKSLTGATIDITIIGDVAPLAVGEAYVDPESPILLEADGTEIDESEYEVTISEITRVSDGKKVNINNITEEAGTYKISYKIVYNGSTYYSSEYDETRTVIVQ